MEQYFVDQRIENSQLILDDKEQYRHIITVLRHKVGDELYFVDNTRKLFQAKLVDIQPEKAIFEVVESKLSMTELPVDVTIACSLSKKDKIEWITQKATELGAVKIVFFRSRYSIMNWKNNVVDKKVSRLQEIAKNAAQQSKRRVIPEVSYLSDLDQLNNVSNDLKLVAYEESAKEGETSILAQQLQKVGVNSIIGVFGPEGGFSNEEVQSLVDHGYQSIGLGPRILRAETAPLYLLSVISYNYELRMNEE